jgi:hypothetical protein
MQTDQDRPKTRPAGGAKGSRRIESPKIMM